MSRFEAEYQEKFKAALHYATRFRDYVANSLLVDTTNRNRLQFLVSEKPIDFIDWAIKNRFPILGRHPFSWMRHTGIGKHRVAAYNKIKSLAGTEREFINRNPLLDIFAWAIKDRNQTLDLELLQWATATSQNLKGLPALIWALNNLSEEQSAQHLEWYNRTREAFYSKETDPIAIAVETGHKIQKRDPIVWAFNQKLKIQGKPPINWAIKNNKTIEGLPAIKWAIKTKTPISRLDPIAYAIKKGLTIDGEAPEIWAINNNYVPNDSDKFISDLNRSPNGIIAIGNIIYMLGKLFESRSNDPCLYRAFIPLLPLDPPSLQTILQISLDYRDAGMIQALIARGTDFSNSNIRIISEDTGEETSISLIQWAAQNHHLQLLIIMMKKSTTPSIQAEFFRQVVSAGNQRIIRHLIESGYFFPDITRDGMPLIHWAIQENDYKLLNAIVSRDKSQLSVLYQGDSPLDKAIILGRTFISYYLFSSSSNIEQMLIDGMPLICYFAHNGMRMHVLYLCQAYPSLIEQTHDRKNAVYYALEKGHFDIAQHLIEKGVSINKSRIVSTIEFVCRNNLEQFSVDILRRNKTLFRRTELNKLLLLAISKDQLKFAALLIECGATFHNKYKDGLPLIEYAIRNHKNKLFYAIFARMNRDVSSNGEALLQMAVDSNNLEIILELIENGVDFNAATKNGAPMLDWAAEIGFKRLFFQLNRLPTEKKPIYPYLTHCANLALQHNQIPLLTILIRQGADASALNTGELPINILGNSKQSIRSH
jgi:ankyrin repeat protein